MCSGLRSGFNMPPGCFRTPADEPEPPCEVCGKDVHECVCHECTECGSVGERKCYKEHGQKLTREQIIAMQEVRIMRAQQTLAYEQQVLDHLRTASDSAIDFNIEEHPDPWS
jgi:hypothetical protein